MEPFISFLVSTTQLVTAPYTIVHTLIYCRAVEDIKKIKASKRSIATSIDA